MAASAEPGFERVVREHHRGVIRICRAVLRDDHLGADAAQETFLRLLRHLRSGATPASFGAWLRRAAVHCSLDLVRRRRVRVTADREAGAAGRGQPRGEADPAETVEARETQARLEAALERLPRGQRTVFLLRHEGGLRLREVAEALDVAPATVKTQFARACLRLQTFLGEQDEAR